MASRHNLVLVGTAGYRASTDWTARRVCRECSGHPFVEGPVRPGPSGMYRVRRVTSPASRTLTELGMRLREGGKAAGPAQHDLAVDVALSRTPVRRVELEKPAVSLVGLVTMAGASGATPRSLVSE